MVHKGEALFLSGEMNKARQGGAKKKPQKTKKKASVSVITPAKVALKGAGDNKLGDRDASPGSGLQRAGPFAFYSENRNG